MVRESFEFSWEPEFTATALSGMLRDIRFNNSQTLGRTKAFYEVLDEAGDILLEAGVAVWSYTRPPELWLMLAKPFFKSLRNSVVLTREALRLPASKFDRLICEVRNTDLAEMRFVKHFGWRPSPNPSFRPDAHLFTQFEVGK